MSSRCGRLEWEGAENRLCGRLDAMQRLTQGCRPAPHQSSKSAVVPLQIDATKLFFGPRPHLAVQGRRRHRALFDIAAMRDYGVPSPTSPSPQECAMSKVSDDWYDLPRPAAGIKLYQIGRAHV